MHFGGTSRIGQWVGLRQCQNNSSQIVDTVKYSCDSLLMNIGFDSAEKKPCAAVKIACKTSSVTWKFHRKCHRKQGHVHRQREGFEVSSSTATRVHHQGVDKVANRKGSCSLKTLVERHGARIKTSDGRINLPETGTLRELNDAKAAKNLAKAFSRGGAPELSSYNS